MALPQDDTTTPFTWGSNGARLTPEQIAAQNKVAAALMEKGSDSSPLPVGTRGNGIWTQGLARVAKSVVGGYEAGEASKASEANAADNRQMIAALLNGGAQPAAAPVAVAPVAAPVASPAPSAAPSPTVAAAASVPTTDSNGVRFYPDASAPTPFEPSAADRDATIRTVYGEAANEPTKGQLAVASVIRNRGFDAGYGGDTPSAVVTAPNQFEPWNGGAATARMQALSPNDPKYAAIGKVVDAANGTGGRAPDDPTDGKTMFYSPGAQAALGRPAPSWAQGDGQVIGGHTFYDDPDDAAPAAPQGKPVQVASNAPAAAFAPVPAPSPGVAAVTAAANGVPVAPAAPAAVTPGVAKVSGALGGVNPAALEAMTSPYADESTKKLGAAIVTSQLGKEKKDTYRQETDADGNVWSVNNATNQRTVAKAAEKDPASVSEYEYYKKNFQPTAQQPAPMDYGTWSTAKARAAATNVTTNVGGENKGMEEAQKLDAEAVRKGQNEKMPALDDADRNFQIMQDAIDRNGGKLPTGGVLGKLGLDARRTSSYIRENWGIDLGDDPTTATSLETFNKGGIKASGDMAKAIGGSRVLKVEFDMAQKANPGLETTDGGNKYLIDLNRNTIGIQKDYLQAQEDYWRGHNHSLDGFQKSWNAEVKSNPRPLSNFSVAPPIDNGDGTQMVKLPSTAQGGYSWYQKGPNGNTVVSDPAITNKLDDAAKPLKADAAAPVEKTVGGKTYVKQDGNWFEKH